MTMDQVREIAEAKMKDLNANDVEAAMQDDRGLGALHGHRGEGLIMAKIAKRLRRRARASIPPSNIRSKKR